VAIDDFGTGFSSFSYILQYNVDRLKIDRSFVSRCLEDNGAAAIVRAIMAMAHGLKIDVVAEGVETLEQMDFLLRKKCDFAQGFLLSKAVALEDFVAAVESIDSWVMEQQEIAQDALTRKLQDLRRPSSKVLEMPSDGSQHKMGLAEALLEGTA
jgi:EAL domain-containing protein (putative c-di-GMP-specific phosphodiesterase class I)